MTNPDHDRTVHACCNRLEVVRYDRAGKWWIENRDGTRHQTTISGAAREAIDCESRGGTIFRLPGGTAFLRAVRNQPSQPTDSLQRGISR